MKIQTMSVVVGTKACNAKCPFCVSRMTGMDVLPKTQDINNRNLDKATALAKLGEVTSVAAEIRYEFRVISTPPAQKVVKVIDGIEMTGKIPSETTTTQWAPLKTRLSTGYPGPIRDEIRRFPMTIREKVLTIRG